MNIEVYFNQSILNNLMKHLKIANSKIYIMHFWFTYKPIIDLLIEKRKEGLDIKILVDFRTYLNYLEDEHNKYNIRAVEYMLQNNLNVKIFKGKMLHHKNILIDDKKVICGSCNLYVESLFYHNEDIVVIVNEEISNRFTSEFLYLYNSSIMNKKDILNSIIYANVNRVKNKLKKKFIYFAKKILKV